MEELNERIKSERIRIGLLQQELADRLKVSKQTVSHWETGQRTPDALTIRELANIFDVTTDYLLCRTANHNEKTNLNNIDSLTPELKKLLENAKDLPSDTVDSVTSMIKNLNKNYKLLNSKIDGKSLNYVLDTNIKPDGLTPEEEVLMHKLISKLEEIRNKD
jgi:transcriptional regulator with XRE-family HTH domain